jgi:hypothetical protein
MPTTLDLPPLLIDPVESRGVILSRCPVASHGKGRGDRNRSLQTRRGRRAWLMKCWAGCDLAAICMAMGLKVSELFDDAPLPHLPRRIQKPPRLDRRRIALDLELHGLLLQERSEKTLQAASGLDCTSWSGDDFDRAVDAVSWAYHAQEWTQVLFAVADQLRERAFAEEQAEKKKKEQR